MRGEGVGGRLVIPQERFETLASGFLDGSLEEAELEELEALLVSSGPARREFLLLAAVHQELASLGRGEAMVAAGAGRAASLRVHRRRGWGAGRVVHVGWLVAAAAVMVMLLLVRSSPGPERPVPHTVSPPVSEAPVQAARERSSDDAIKHVLERPDEEMPTQDESRNAEPHLVVVSEDSNPQQLGAEEVVRSSPAGHIAYLDAIEGEAELARTGSGAWICAQAGAPIGSGDRLRTRLSRARVVFKSGSVLYVNRWTTMTISRISSAQAPFVGMVGGELYVEVAPQDRGFAVETPHGRAVDLGTRFAVEVKPAGTTLAVVEGRVRASTDVGSAELGAGQEVFLARLGSPPGRPRKVSLEERLAWLKALRRSDEAAARLENLALGRPASCSSEYESDVGYFARNGNDGSLETLWASAEGDGLPWWQVDLGAPCRVVRVEMVARQEEDVDYPSARTGFEVRGSNRPDGRDYVVLASHKGRPFEHRGTWTAVVSDPRVFRYVRVVHVNRRHFNFAEFRVFGVVLGRRAP